MDSDIFCRVNVHCINRGMRGKQKGAHILRSMKFSRVPCTNTWTQIFSVGQMLLYQSWDEGETEGCAHSTVDEIS